MDEDDPIWKAIDRGGGQTCHVSGVLRELTKAGYVILTASPLPDDRVRAAAKFLRENIPLVLNFHDKAVGFTIMAGVEDLARGVLALAAPASPLPDEVAGLIERLHGAIDFERQRALKTPAESGPSLLAMTDAAAVLENWISVTRNIQEAAFAFKAERDKLAAALQQQARENSELKAADRDHLAANRGMQIRLEARIRELEAEVQRDREAFDGLNALHHENVAKWRERISELETERDTAEAAVIKMAEDIGRAVSERAAIKAKTIEESVECVEWFRNVTGWNCDDVIERIRALIQPAGDPSISAQGAE